MAFAPPTVKREVTEHLADLARQKKVPKTRLMAVWREYRKLIVFKTPSAVEHPGIDRLRARDPDDVPIAQLMVDLKAHILLTRDADFSETGLPQARPIDLLVDLQAYARNKTVEMSVYFGGYFVTRLSIDVVRLAAKLLRVTWQGFRRLPSWAQATIVVGGAICVLNQLSTPEKRARLLAKLDKATGFLLNAFGPIGEALEESRSLSGTAWNRVESRLTRTPAPRI